MNGMTVLVTGSTGFLGRRVVHTLLEQGITVRCLVHNPGREVVFGRASVDVHYGNIKDPFALRSALHNVDAVVHLVAVIREKRNATYQTINVQGVQALTQAAVTSRVKRMVLVSAVGARDNPEQPYLHSKWLGEQAVIESGVPYTILRPSIIFGEGDEFLTILARLIKTLPIVPIAGVGNSEFQPVAAEDVARCITAVLHNDTLLNRMVEIGGPEKFTYNQLVKTISDTMLLNRRYIHIPLSLMKPIIRILDRISPRAPVTINQLTMLNTSTAPATDSVLKTFGFHPKPLTGNIDFVNNVTAWDGIRTIAGFMPHNIPER